MHGTCRDEPAELDGQYLLTYADLRTFNHCYTEVLLLVMRMILQSCNIEKDRHRLDFRTVG